MYAIFKNIKVYNQRDFYTFEGHMHLCVDLTNMHVYTELNLNSEKKDIPF